MSIEETREQSMPEGSRTYVVRPSTLKGKVSLQGAKNSALRLLAASILTPESIVISNFPSRILDAQVHVDMLEALGKKCEVEGDTITISEPSQIAGELQWEDRSIRNTLLILGASLARMGRGSVPLPGGCQIGERKFDLHAMVMESLGARVSVSDSGEQLRAEAPGRLSGAEIHLPIRSTGATENAILCSSLAKGVTRIWNPHIRPEILDLIDMLNKMGARIRVFGHAYIEVEGVEELGGTTHSVVPDNIEAITWIVASLITRGDVEIENVPFDHLEVPLIHLRESGADLYRDRDNLIVRNRDCFPVEISTGPYPGINSDMQPLFAALAVCAQGESRITDLRFPDRYKYSEEMAKMGASFHVLDNMLVIDGRSKLVGTRTRALDLRAGAALALLGLVADGETTIEDVWQIERGYQDFPQKLCSLGAQCIVEG